MTPLLRSGEKLRLVGGYYRDQPAKVGDIVAYHYGGKEVPLIKMVRVTHDDMVEIGDGTLVINGETMKNSAGETYFFTP